MDGRIEPEIKPNALIEFFWSSSIAIINEIAALMEQRSQIEEQGWSDAVAAQRADMAVSLSESTSLVLTGWDNLVIRQMVDTVRVLSADRIVVYLRGGIEIQQDIEK